MSIIDHLCGAFGALPVRALRQLSVECKKGVEELEPKVDAIVKEYEDAKNLAAAVEKAIADKDAERCLKADADDKTDWHGVLAWWNALAQEQDLVGIRRMTAARKTAWQAMAKDDPDFQETLVGAIRQKRNSWAKDNKFPTFEQALRPDLYDKLVGGWYEKERGAEEKKNERVSSFGGAAETS